MEAPSSPGRDLAALYTNAACGLACTAEDGVFLTINDTYCKWLGRSPDELIGKVKLQDLLSVGGRIFHQTHWAPLLRMQGSISEVKLDAVGVGGARIPLVMNAIRRESPDGFVHEVAVFMARDRDAYERELIASRTKLQALVEETARLHSEARDRALFAEQMIGIVSHDLRNPLSAIQMGTVLLARAGADPRMQETVLGRVNRASDRAVRLIADLLDFTQARLGKGLAVAIEPMDLNECVAGCVDELALAYGGRTLQHLHTGAANCDGDCDRLSQLVGNLVSNAMVYGHEGLPVEVMSAVHGDRAVIAVRNWGNPIAPELQERLFQPMVRGEVDAGSRSVGLGLYIVSEIARAHGGHVAVTSSAAKGTTFTASFPAHH
ncbi:MAG: PAS domain-containing sensor histidine kinase [Pseudomonadota bacterium]